LILANLIDLAFGLGYHAIVAQIVGGNHASVRLHERFGFETVGVLKEVGRKFDMWLDIVLMQKIL
jgi:L-amino acid N-acyltransferase YncA